MNKKVTNNKLNYKSIVFWGIIALLTITFIITIIVRFVNSQTINDYDSLTHLTGEEVFTQNEEEYIVYFYSSDEEYSEASSAVEEVFFNYATFRKRNSGNSDVLKAYVVDLADPENAKCVVFESERNDFTGTTFADLKISDKSIPVMIVIKDGKISTYKTTDNDISSYLQEIIEANK